MFVRSIIILFIKSMLVTAAEDSLRQHENNWDKIGFKVVDISELPLNHQLIENNVTQHQNHSKLDNRSIVNDINPVASGKGFDYYDYVYDSSGERPADRRKRAIIDNREISWSTYIISGTQANINMYPWMVYINMVSKGKVHTNISSCGGSLISTKFVLSAAHCFESLVKKDDIHVILAEHNTQTYPQDCIYYPDGYRRCFYNVHMSAEDLIVHKHFNKKKIINDIALIKLKGIAPISEFIHPIPLPTFDIDKPQNTGMELTIAGWGYTFKDGQTSSVKLETNVNLVPYAKCWRTTKVVKRKLCAIGRRGQDACHGDSGGPLMAYNRGHHFLAGIVSGKSYYNKDADCGSSVPTTYTNVFMYLTWIKENMRI